MSQSQRRSRRRRTTAAATPAPAGEPGPVDAADDATVDLGVITPETRARDQLQRKRAREKRARLDANARFAALAALLHRIEREEDLAAAAGHAATRRKRKRKSVTLAPSDANFTPTDRADLISKTIGVLERLHAQNGQLRKDCRERSIESAELKRTAEDLARKHEQAEAATTLAALGAARAVDMPKQDTVTTPERKRTAEDLTRKLKQVEAAARQAALGAAHATVMQIQDKVEDLARKHVQRQIALGAAHAAAAPKQDKVEDLARKQVQAEAVAPQVALGAANAAAATPTQDKVEDLARKHEQAEAAAQQATVDAAPAAATPKQDNVEGLARRQQTSRLWRQRTEAATRQAASGAAHVADTPEQDKDATMKSMMATMDQVGWIRATHGMQMPSHSMPPHMSAVAIFAAQMQHQQRQTQPPAATSALLPLAPSESTATAPMPHPAPQAPSAHATTGASVESQPVPPDSTTAAPAPRPGLQTPPATPTIGAAVSSKPTPPELTDVAPAPQASSAPPSTAATRQLPVIPLGFPMMMPPIPGGACFNNGVRPVQSAPLLSMANHMMTPSTVIPNPFLQQYFTAAATATAAAASPAAHPQQSTTSSSQPVPSQQLQFLSQLSSQLASGTSTPPASRGEPEKPQEGQDPMLQHPSRPKPQGDAGSDKAPSAAAGRCSRKQRLLHQWWLGGSLPSSSPLGDAEDPNDEAAQEKCEERLEDAGRSVLDGVGSERDDDEEKRTIREEIWNSKFEALRKYRAEHGDCRVSVRHDAALAYWVFFNRKEAKKGGKGRKGMSDRRRKKLESIGFE